MPSNGRWLIVAAHWRGVLVAGSTSAVFFLIAGCRSSAPSPTPPGFAPFARPSASTSAAAGLTPALIAGHWEITSFRQSGKIMDTCLGEDASIDFALDGTWLAHNRDDGHSYGGAYRFSGVSGLALTAGQYQQYDVSVSGDAMTLLGGRTLRITLQWSATPTATSALDDAAW